jgi:hypothetical protein
MFDIPPRAGEKTRARLLLAHAENRAVRDESGILKQKWSKIEEPAGV